MCLAVPVQITSIPSPGRAHVTMEGVGLDVATTLVPLAKVGDFVLVHAGFAIEILSDERARDMIDLFNEYYSLIGKPE